MITFFKIEIEAKSVQAIATKSDEQDVWDRNAKAFYASCTNTGLSTEYKHEIYFKISN